MILKALERTLWDLFFVSFQQNRVERVKQYSLICVNHLTDKSKPTNKHKNTDVRKQNSETYRWSKKLHNRNSSINPDIEMRSQTLWGDNMDFKASVFGYD